MFWLIDRLAILNCSLITLWYFILAETVALRRERNKETYGDVEVCVVRNACRININETDSKTEKGRQTAKQEGWSVAQIKVVVKRQEEGKETCCCQITLYCEIWIRQADRQWQTVIWTFCLKERQRVMQTVWRVGREEVLRWVRYYLLEDSKTDRRTHVQRERQLENT